MTPADHSIFKDHQDVWRRIEEAALSHGLSEKLAYEVAFHMLDWHQDLAKLVAFMESPESQTTEDLEKMLLDFLIHVPNHIAAAGKLYTGIGVADIFDVDACNDEDE